MKHLLFTVVLLCTILSFGNSQPPHHQTAKPAAGKLWTLPFTGKAGIVLCRVPKGHFIMGSPASEPGCKTDESPQTEVTLTKDYWLSKMEITIAQWKAVTGMDVRAKAIKLLNDTTRYDFSGKKILLRDFMGFKSDDPDKILANENGQLPMYFVSWYEAMDFCKKLTRREHIADRLPKGYRYTLPTEAQWEYACRAGSTGPIYGGNTDSVAWYIHNSSAGYTGRGFGHPLNGPRNAGTKQANKWGLQDMLGNLWEWCRDWYGPYPGGSLIDPKGPAHGTVKVNRGGSFGSGLNDERSANRASNPPNEASAYRGFRIVLSAN